MMNKLKKILSLVLVLIMLVSAMPMQSFALSLKPLKITGVEFANDNPISMKYVNANSGWGEKVSLEEDYFDTVDTFYDFYVYFSDGDKVLYSEIYEKDEISGMSLPSLRVDYDECYNAILNDEETVNVYIDLYLHTNKKDLTYECTLEKKIVPYIVRNMKPVSELPTQVYSDMYGTEAFGGALFEVEYYGGTKEIVTCGYGEGMVFAPGEYGFYESNSFAYLDAYYYHEYEKIDPLYTAVKIDDCEFADNKLKEVTFTLTKNDGTTEQYTRNLDIDINDYDYEVEKINGYDVVIYYSNYWPTFTSDGEFKVSIYIGENSDEVVFEPEDVCSCKICHYKGIRYIYYYMIDQIWKLFRINQYCVCGSENWYT